MSYIICTRCGKEVGGWNSRCNCPNPKDYKIEQLKNENKQLKENIEALQHELKTSTACGIRIQEKNKALSDRIINFKIFIGSVWESLPENVKEHWARVQL